MLALFWKSGSTLNSLEFRPWQSTINNFHSSKNVISCKQNLLIKNFLDVKKKLQIKDIKNYCNINIIKIIKKVIIIDIYVKRHIIIQLKCKTILIFIITIKFKVDIIKLQLKVVYLVTHARIPITIILLLFVSRTTHILYHCPSSWMPCSWFASFIQLKIVYEVDALF